MNDRENSVKTKVLTKLSTKINSRPELLLNNMETKYIYKFIKGQGKETPLGFFKWNRLLKIGNLNNKTESILKFTHFFLRDNTLKIF